MHYQVTVFIGTKVKEEGWQKIESSNLVGLINTSERIQIKFIEEIVQTEVEGQGGIILLRENKGAKLVNKARGNVKIGDKIWLLNQRAEVEFKSGERENFAGAAIMVELVGEEIEKKQGIYVNEKAFFQERNNKSVNLILGLIVFGLLIVGTFLGYKKRTENEQKKKFEEITSEVEKKITETESVRTVNMETALQLAQSAESIINNAEVIEKKYSQELIKLKEKISEIKKGLGEENLDYEVAYDTSLIKEGGGFKGMAIKESIVYLWGVNLGQINSVDINLKSTEKIVSDERIKLWLGIFNNGEKWYGYDQSKIYEIKRNDLVEGEIRGVKTVEEITGWNGLVYVLDNGSQNIEKLNNGEGKIWLKEGTNLNEEATSMSIDSNIWVLGKSGKIYRYNRGVEEKITMSSLPTLATANNLKTSDQVDFLAYVVDGNTVVIYGKDGKILWKYNFGKIKINDIGIENQNKAVLVLAENGKIYRIKIK